MSLFTQFLEKIYLARIDEFNGEEFFYTSEYVDHGYAEVTSEVFTSDGKEFNIRPGCLRLNSYGFLFRSCYSMPLEEAKP